MKKPYTSDKLTLNVQMSSSLGAGKAGPEGYNRKILEYALRHNELPDGTKLDPMWIVKAKELLKR